MHADCMSEEHKRSNNQVTAIAAKIAKHRFASQRQCCEAEVKWGEIMI